MLVTFAAVVKPGGEDEIADFRFRLGGELGFAGEAFFDDLGPDAGKVEAAAVVGDFDDDVAALVPGGQADGALRWLAGGDPLGRRFDAVIGAVAHQVRERILDQIEHLAVELGIGAAHR